MYIDKIHADAEDGFEGRPMKPMRNFIAEWFLCKFGVKAIAETFFKDFMKSVLDYEPSHDRFKIFLGFCGIRIQKAAIKSRDKKREEIFNAQVQSLDCLRFYLRVSTNPLIK